MRYAKAPNLKSRKNIAPDGAGAVEDARYADPRTLLAGNLPSRRYRSLGKHLAAEREWFVKGAWDGPVPLRDPSLSDGVAGDYFDRFLGLVQFVDDQGGERLETVYDYLDLTNIRPWLDYFVNTQRYVKKTDSYKAYTAQYLCSLVRALRALGRCFIGNPDSDNDAWDWFQGVKQILAKAGRVRGKCSSSVKMSSVNAMLLFYSLNKCCCPELQAVSDLRRKPKVREDLLVEDAEPEDEGDPALVFVVKEHHDLQSILARLHVFEERMRKKEASVGRLGKRSDAQSAKERYELARMKQAHLASLLLLWHSGRLSAIKNLVLNWDLRKVKIGGRVHWVMDPSEFKTKWRSHEMDVKEVPWQRL